MVWRVPRGDTFGPARRMATLAAAAQVNLRGHVPALDAIRGLAIVLVTLYRFGGGTEGAARAIENYRLVEIGTRGVDLFFVLSGFLITGILFDAKGKDHYFRNFYMRRSLRIFPLYYGVLALCLVLLPLVSSFAQATFQPAIEGQAWLWLYGANVLQGWSGTWPLAPLNHFWSLAVEEHFYLVWPLVICLTNRKTALWICGGLIGTSVVWRTAWLLGGGNDVATEVFTLFRLDALALGGWLALVARGKNGLTWLSRLALPALILSGLFVLSICLASMRLLALPQTMWAVFFGALLILTVVARPGSLLARLGSSRSLQFFGKYSYGMYVFQCLLIPLMAGIVTAPGLAAALGNAWLGQLAYCALMFGLTTLVALASWHGFEKHCLSLKRRFGG